MMMTQYPPPLPSGALVNADAHAFLDGHSADGGLGRQLRGLRGELLLQDPQDTVHFMIHLVDLDWRHERSNYGQRV